MLYSALLILAKVSTPSNADLSSEVIRLTDAARQTSWVFVIQLSVPDATPINPMVAYTSPVQQVIVWLETSADGTQWVDAVSYVTNDARAKAVVVPVTQLMTFVRVRVQVFADTAGVKPLYTSTVLLGANEGFAYVKASDTKRRLYRVSV